MDIWEANSISTAYTAHACEVKSQQRCEGVDCGDNASGDRFHGKCDKNGCDFQTYRLGNTSFFGPGSGYVIDTTKPLTVTTQFVTDDGTDSGRLSEIRRTYQQGSRTVPTPTLPVGSSGKFSELSEGYCEAEVALFADGTNFLQKGGFGSMDDAFEKGMVLVMSIWDDHDVNMLWLDSTYPVNGTSPGDARGTCPLTSGAPKDVESQHPHARVTYSNIRFGEIGSTTGDAPSPPTPSPPTPTPPPSGCPAGSLSGCIGLCPTAPAAAYAACVKECVARCSPRPDHAAGAALATPASETHAPSADAWALCGADEHCPLGWECSTRAAWTAGSFRQCTPQPALLEAFLLTGPDAAAARAFIAEGTTHFAASGLPRSP